jgi:quercetin dioxygenase-like cupin family protein
VLSGECIAVVEGEERRMGPWDYLHCPPGTNHITVGAGDTLATSTVMNDEASIG